MKMKKKPLLWVISVLEYACLVIFICLVLFSLFNYKSHCVTTDPQLLIHTQLMTDEEKSHLCQLQLNYDSLDTVDLDIFHEPTFQEIQEENRELSKGGAWKPKGCNSYQKVAVVLPYRNRLHHLRLLLKRLHPLLQKQKIEYRIFLIEQEGNDRFNRGKLMNVGFLESLKIDNFDCFIFHDVDLLPESDKNLYLCDEHLRQYSSAIDETRYHVMFYNYAGGVIGIKAENFRQINGYANSYWGWGNEDDDLSARVQTSGLLITRPPEHIGRFKMVRHKKETRSENGYEAFLGWRGRWLKDGVNTRTVNYTVVKVTEEALYTNVTVDLGPSEGHMVDPSKDTTRETLWWFLKFYFP